MNKLEHPIVKYDNKWWTMESIENGKAVLWRDGKRVTVDLELVEHFNKG